MNAPIVTLIDGVTGQVCTPVSLASIAETIRTGLRAETAEVRRLYLAAGGGAAGKKACKLAKERLPAVMLAGRFTARGDANFEEAAGTAPIDLDGLTAVRQAELRAKLVRDRHVALLFSSPTGSGLKLAICTGVTEASDPEHRAAFDAARAYLQETYGVTLAEFDESSRNPERLAFLGHDAHVHFNATAVPLDWEWWGRAGTYVQPAPSAPVAEKRRRLREDYGYANLAHDVDLCRRALAETPGAVEGAFGNDATVAAARIGWDFNLSPATVFPLLVEWNQTCSPPWDATDLAHKRDNAYVYADREKGGRSIGDLVNAPLPPAPATPATEGARLLLRAFSDTAEEKPAWLWDGYLLRKGTSVMGSRQGEGKGLLCASIIAKLSTGQPMPDGSGGGAVVRTLIVTREDDPAMSLAPRLRVAGANLANVFWSTGDYGIGSDNRERALESMKAAAPLIAAAVREHRIELLVIDPIGAWIEDDGNSAAQVRAVIDPLNRLARQTNCAVLLVAHLRKAPADEPMDAFAGSHAVTAAVRVAMVSAPINGSEHSLTVVKSNFRKPASPMVWFLMSGMDDEPPIVAWRVGGAVEAAMAAQRQQRRAPMVNPADVLPHLVAEHRRLDEEARRVHKLLLPTLRGLTVQAVKEALLQLIVDGKAYEGGGPRGVRTVGLLPAVVAKSMLELAVDVCKANPTATVRAIADLAGCSKSLAARAKVLSTTAVHNPGVEVVDKWTGEMDKAADLVHHLSRAPIGGAGVVDKDAAGTVCPVAP